MGASVGRIRATPAERQQRIERVAELANKYNLTYAVIAERLGITKRQAIDDATEAKKQELLKPR